MLRIFFTELRIGVYRRQVELCIFMVIAIYVGYEFYGLCAVHFCTLICYVFFGSFVTTFYGVRYE